MSWSLDGVVPVRWTGPAFNVESPKVANETLEMAYHGFIEAAAPAAGAETVPPSTASILKASLTILEPKAG